MPFAKNKQTNKKTQRNNPKIKQKPKRSLRMNSHINVNCPYKWVQAI